MIALSAFRNLHQGEPVAILGNGPTLADHDLARLTCKTIGTNMSWLKALATYHVAVEHGQAGRDPGVYRGLDAMGRLFVAGGGWNIGHVMNILNPHHGAPEFSRDIEDGVVVSMDGCGSVVYVAIQLAAYMGFTPIHLLGVDLYGEHFHGRWATSEMIERQNELFAHVPEDVKVYVVGSPESRARFPKLTFEAVAA